MSHKALLSILAASAALVSFSALASDCAFRADRSLDIDVKGIEALRLDTVAGDLRVEGVAGLDHVEVRATACASQKSALDGMRLDEKRDGATVTAKTVIPDDRFRWRLFGSIYAYMDVVVRMPETLKLVVRDSSGDLAVSHLRAGLDLTDSSGDIDIRDMAGDLVISDSSGDMDIANVKGNVTVRVDSSGDIRITNVSGDAIVKTDSSGDIEFKRIGGDARVDQDSSGDIDFADIGRNAIAGSDSSGSINASNVRGDFTVKEKSSGSRNISHSNVGGNVSLPSGE